MYHSTCFLHIIRKERCNLSEDTQNTHEEEIIIPKYYGPHSDLTEWFRKRLILEHQRKEFSKKGQKPTESFHNKIKSSGARKAEFLDEIIFPSMANLIYFFEALEISPSLKKLFEKDLIKLLDPRFSKKHAKQSEMGLNISSWAFRWNSFARLVSNALSLDMGTNKILIRNFRVALIYQIQTIIRDEIKKLLTHQYGITGQITKAALNDFESTMGWLALLAKSISDEADKESDRVMGFAPISYSNKGETSRLRF